MNALVAATPGSWAESISGFLSAAGFTVERLRPGAVAPQERTLLIYSRPEYAVEAAIAAGQKIDPALGEWVREANLVLDLFRRNRSTVTVLDGPTLVSNPELFRTWAKGTLGVTVPERPASSTSVESAAVSRVIAAQCVSSSLDLRDLAGELEACAIPLGEEPPEYTVSWEDAYGELQRSHVAGECAKQELEELRSSVEEREVRVRELSGEVDELKQRAKETGEALERVRSEQGAGTKELEEENELLLLQLHQVQEELESYYLEAKDLREKQGAATARDQEELSGYALMLEHLYLKLLRSRTWKVLAPVREVMRVVKSVLRGKRMPRNRLPDRPAALEGEPVGGFYGKRSKR